MCVLLAPFLEASKIAATMLIRSRFFPKVFSPFVFLFVLGLWCACGVTTNKSLPEGSGYEA
jgi:hypothetical protein